MLRLPTISHFPTRKDHDAIQTLIDKTWSVMIMAGNNFSSGKVMSEEGMLTPRYSDPDCLPKEYSIHQGYESFIITMTLDNIYASSIQKEAFVV